MRRLPELYALAAIRLAQSGTAAGAVKAGPANARKLCYCVSMRSKARATTMPGSVRIIGGKWRRRRLVLPAKGTVRPTPDRVRETLFNWLQHHVIGADVLDLFAGSGVLGFEALSRGARGVTMVERNATLCDALREQSQVLGATVDIVQAEAGGFLTRQGQPAFDLVFVDPPFDQPVEPFIQALAPFLNPGAKVYVERPAAQGLPDLAGFDWLNISRAGSIRFGLAAQVKPANDSSHDADLAPKLQ